MLILLSSLAHIPITFSSPREPIVSPSKARVTDIVLVEGQEGDVGGGSTAILYLDKIKTWDGCSGALNATTSLYSGYYNMTFKVPEIPGGLHLLIVEEADSSLEATAHLTIIPQLNILDYIYRDYKFILSGNGFAESANVMLLLREKNGDPKIDNWPSYSVNNEIHGIGDGETRSYVSTLSHTPVKPGTISISDGVETLQDSGCGKLYGSNGGFGKVDYVTGEIHTKFKATPLNNVQITCAYDHFEGVTDIHQLAAKPLKASTMGSVYSEMKIESLDYGDYYLCALDSLNNTIVMDVMLCPKITINPAEADVGDLVTVQGYGFTPGTGINSVKMYQETWEGVECEIVTPSPTVSSKGVFEIQVFVPQVPMSHAAYILEVTDNNGLKSRKTIEIHDQAYVEYSLERGDSTYRVNLIGRNYQNKVNQRVSIELKDVDNPSISYQITATYTNKNGVINTTFVVTTNNDQRFTLRAYSQDANIESETTLQITQLIVELSKYNALPGETINVNGRGFTPKKHWNATFHGITIVSTKSGIVTSKGGLKLSTSSAKFKVPEEDPGEYRIRFTDVDTGHSIEVHFTVDEGPVVFDKLPPVPIIQCLNTGLEGELFYLSSKGSFDGDGVILYYTWSFGDGFSSNNMNPIHKYNRQGNYTIELTVKDNDGYSSTATKTILIKDKDTLVDFIVVNSEGFAPLVVQFQETSVSYDQIIGYEWDFGDGYKSNDRNPIHTYISTGYYDVSLTLQDFDGETFTTKKKELVKVWRPDFLAPEIMAAEAETLTGKKILVTAFVIDDQRIQTVTFMSEIEEVRLSEVTGAPGLYKYIVSSFNTGKIVAKDIAGNVHQIELSSKSSPEADPLFTLSPGWNDVLVPRHTSTTSLEKLRLSPLGLRAVSAQSQSADRDFATQPTIESIWTYDPYIGYLMYDPTSGYGEIKSLEPGKRYWIKVSEDYPIECLLVN